MTDINLGLVKKYNIRGPRYTSYPTAVQFRETAPGDEMVVKRYLAGRNLEPRPVSLYFHIPFCYSLCWFCGCTKVITRDQGSGDRYLDYLEREMDTVAELMNPASEVVQVHFGGGTPTFLTPEQLGRLGAAIRNRFEVSDDTEFSVEIDPRRCTRKHIRALAGIGCNRASLGVQDTDPVVQEAIHRIQPLEQTERVTGWLREEGIGSVNIDLIYGLPRQTTIGFEKTMAVVLQLAPERIALYSYAHIPGVMPAQRLLNPDEMPPVDQKLGMMKNAIDYFTGNGYRFIGMDHFARTDGELSQALENGTLQRNFQGYSTRGGADLYAFGMSGISNAGELYWQNSKELPSYYDAVDRGRWPVAKWLRLDRDDRIRRDVIMQLMCKRTLDSRDVEQQWDIDFKNYFRDALEALAEPEKDGLVEMDGECNVTITGRGQFFLRNIAMCFDRYLKQADALHTFSKTV